MSDITGFNRARRAAEELAAKGENNAARPDVGEAAPAPEAGRGQGDLDGEKANSPKSKQGMGLLAKK